MVEQVKDRGELDTVTDAQPGAGIHVPEVGAEASLAEPALLVPPPDGERSAATPPVANERERPSPRSNTNPDAEHKRKLQGLQLQRERILSEKTASAHRRQALGYALADIEEKLAELGWTIHL